VYPMKIKNPYPIFGAEVMSHPRYHPIRLKKIQAFIPPLTQAHDSDYLSPERLRGEFTTMLTGSHQPPAL